MAVFIDANMNQAEKKSERPEVFERRECVKNMASSVWSLEKLFCFLDKSNSEIK